MSSTLVQPKKRIQLYFVLLLSAFAVFLNISFVCREKKIENSPPKITITSPLDQDHFSWNATIRYAIKITDNEDGSSEYDEISGKEVLLEVCYLKDASIAKSYLAGKNNKVIENKGLRLLKKSDCFTCHASKDKLIGPSFELIAKRYPFNKSSLEHLSKKVISGGKDTWGPIAMPAHAANTIEEVREMISWILTNNSNPNISFYPGLEGAFHTKGKAPNATGKEVLVVTASYTDQGEKKSNQNRKFVQHSVLLKATN